MAAPLELVCVLARRRRGQLTQPAPTGPGAAGRVLSGPPTSDTSLTDRSNTSFHMLEMLLKIRFSVGWWVLNSTVLDPGGAGTARQNPETQTAPHPSHVCPSHQPPDGCSNSAPPPHSDALSGSGSNLPLGVASKAGDTPVLCC